MPSSEALWVPVVPETSQFGPKMEQAGREAHAGFSKSAKDIGKALRDNMSESIKGIESGFKDIGGALRTSISNAGKDIKSSAPQVGKEFAEGLGRSIGEALGRKASDVLEPFEDKIIDLGHSLGEKASETITPFIDKLKTIQGNVSVIGTDLGEAFDSLKSGDVGGTLSGVSQSISDIASSVGQGDKVAGFVDSLQNVASVAGGISEGVQAFKDLSAATKLAIAPTLALDAAEDANPVGAVVLAVEALVAALAALVKGVMYAYNHWQWFHDAVQKVWDVLKKVGGYIKDVAVAAFNDLKTAAKAVWDHGIKPLWDGLKTGWETVKRDVLEPLSSAFHTAFDKVKQVVQNVIDWFKQKFDDLTNIISKPIDMLKNFGGGLVDKASGFLSHFGLAGGGAIFGPGMQGSDSLLSMLAPGEHVWTHDEVRGAGGHGVMYMLRALARAGVSLVPGFSGGGAAGGGGRAASGPARAIAYADSMIGTPYSQARRNDCSGMVSQIVNAYLGVAPRSSLMTTRNEASWLQARGFQMGQGPAGTLRVGWYNHGSAANDGHTALTLPDGENAESGGSHGNFLVGAGAVGAGASEFDHHAWLPRNPQGESSGGIGGLGAAMGASGGGKAGTTGSGGGGGGAAGGGGGGDAGIGGGGGGGSANPKDFGKAMASGLLQELGLDGSVFKNPLSMPIPKMGESLLNDFTKGLGKMAQSSSGAGFPTAAGPNTDLGIGGLGNLVPSISAGAHTKPASSVKLDRANQPGSGVTVNNDNSFHVSGVGSVQEQKEQYNASQRSVPTTVVNGGVINHG